jgi:putative two-component system response regulator
MKHILIADDEDHIRGLIRIACRRLVDQGAATVTEAGDGQTALRLAREMRPDLILLDINMPGLSGIDCCRALRAEPETRDVPIVLLTSYGEPEMIRRGLDAGATRYITKPFRPRQLIELIEEFLAVRPDPGAPSVIGEPAVADSGIGPQLWAYADDLSGSLEELRAAHRELRLAYLATVEALGTALETRDVETAGHCARVSAIALELARGVEYPEDELPTLQLGAVLHDVGKIGVPDAILRKPGSLTDDEWVIMKQHPEMGERMLRGIRFLRRAVAIVRSHHERWDGRGYPDGLAGADIPLGARIFVVADSVDAMTSDRPYRAALSWEQAYEEVRRGRGSQFDPLVVESFWQRAGHLRRVIEGPVPALSDVLLP